MEAVDGELRNPIAVSVAGCGFYLLNAFGRGSEVRDCFCASAWMSFLSEQWCEQGSYAWHGHGGHEPGLSLVVPTHLTGTELVAAIRAAAERTVAFFRGMPLGYRSLS